MDNQKFTTEDLKESLKRNARSFDHGEAIIDLWFEAHVCTIIQADELENYLSEQLFPLEVEVA